MCSMCGGAQGEDPGYAWTVTVIGFWLQLALGLVCFVLSLAWVLQVQPCSDVRVHAPAPLRAIRNASWHVQHVCMLWYEA